MIILRSALFAANRISSLTPFAIIVSLPQLAPKSLYTLDCSIGSNFEIPEKYILFLNFCCKQMQNHPS
jgi:hypothetical protein